MYADDNIVGCRKLYALAFSEPPTANACGKRGFCKIDLGTLLCTVVVDDVCEKSLENK